MVKKKIRKKKISAPQVNDGYFESDNVPPRLQVPNIIKWVREKYSEAVHAKYGDIVLLTSPTLPRDVSLPSVKDFITWPICINSRFRGVACSDPRSFINRNAKIGVDGDGEDFMSDDLPKKENEIQRESNVVDDKLSCKSDVIANNGETMPDENKPSTSAPPGGKEKRTIPGRTTFKTSSFCRLKRRTRKVFRSNIFTRCWRSDDQDTLIM